MVWLHNGEKIFEDMIICFDRIMTNVTAIQTPHDSIGCACIASCGNKTRVKIQDLEHGRVSTNPWGSLPFSSHLAFLPPFPSFPPEARGGVLCESWGY